MGVINTFVNVTKTDQSLAPLKNVRDRSRPAPSQSTKLMSGSTTVGRLLSALRSSAPHSLLLGQCDDGLPFLLELGEPELGAILVSCERGAGKTHHLQVMAESAMHLNIPSQLQLGVLTFKPGEWQGWQTEAQRRKYLQGVYAWYDPWAAGLIQTLVDLAEVRREGQRFGADVLLILDDLNFVEELSYEAQVNLHWLLEYGSQSGIWLIGAINAHQAADFRYWIDPFRTRIIGQVKSLENHEILAMRLGPGTEAFEPAVFRTLLSGNWHSYRLPLLGQ
jgi:hypothetical protein